MMSAYSRFLNDERFRTLVMSIETHLRDGYFTPTEVREAAVLACVRFEMSTAHQLFPTGIPSELEERFKQLRKIMDAPHRLTEETPYGLCPKCGAPGVAREKRPDGNDTCRNGHIYPSKDAIKVGV